MLSSFVDGELDTSATVVLDSHLRWCRTCERHARDLAALGESLRLGASAVLPEDAGDLDGLRVGVVSRLSAESAQSWTAICRQLFAERRVLYAGAGATVGVIICVLMTIGVVSVAERRAADSMAAILDTLAHPGSDANPVTLGGRVVPPQLALPELYDDSPELVGLPQDDAVFAVATRLSMDGRVARFQILPGDRPPVDLTRLQDAVARARFTPAQSGGTPVAVDMLWLVANTTVRASFAPIDFEKVLADERKRAVG